MTTIFDNCWAKTNALELKHDNKLRPCCVFKDLGFDLDDSISKVLDKYKNYTDEQITNACKTCIAKSQSNSISKKDYFNEVKDQGYVFFYDLQLSNLCNLACTMCNSQFSSRWETLGDQLNRDYLIGFDKDSNKQWNVQALQKIVQHIDQQTQQGDVVISIKGGEPTIQPEVEQFINSLKSPQRIDFRIITNLQRWPTWFDSGLEKFKRVDIGISIEGIEETYEYSRVYGSWKTFSNNVEQLVKLSKEYKNIKCGWKGLVTNHTVGDLARLNKYTRSYNSWTNGGWDRTNFVLSPIYMNPTILPYSIAKPITESFDSFFSVLKSNMLEKNNYSSKHFENFIDYTKRLDAVLGKNFLDTPTGKYFREYI